MGTLELFKWQVFLSMRTEKQNIKYSIQYKEQASTNTRHNNCVHPVVAYDARIFHTLHTSLRITEIF
jgi:hypothetical protein